MEVATGTAVKNIFSTDVTAQEIALIGQFAENRFIGVNCGIMDQFASAMGKKDHAVLLDSNTLEYEYAPISGASLMIVNSKVKHSLASSAYNTRRRECETAKSALGVTALCLMSPDEFESKKGMIKDENCLKRARHAVREEERAIGAAKALRNGDMKLFGKLMNKSHLSLKEDFEVSCAELDFLAATAQSLPYVYGARMTGGGFGGCTVNLIESGKERAFGQFIKTEYEKSFSITPDVYCVQASNGAYAE